jgi:hypothetical protein
MIFIAIGGDAWVIQGVAETYEVVPLDAYPKLGALVAGADSAFVSVFSAAIQVAGPVVLALILADAAFGVVSRVVPQLNVFAVGFPAKVFVGLVLIGVSQLRKGAQPATGTEVDPSSAPPAAVEPAPTATTPTLPVVQTASVENDLPPVPPGSVIGVSMNPNPSPTPSAKTTRPSAPGTRLTPPPPPRPPAKATASAKSLPPGLPQTRQ